MSNVSRLQTGSLAAVAMVVVGALGLSVLGAMLIRFGVPTQIVVLFFIVPVLALAVLTALGASDAEGGANFREAAGETPPRINGIAVSMEWLSGFGLFGIVGALFAFGHDGLTLVIGLAAGFVLSAILIAPRLNRTGARSLPDFLSLRYGSSAIRGSALVAFCVVTVLVVVVQLVACGLIAEFGIGAPRSMGVVIGAAAMLIMVLPSGMRSMTAAQIALATIAVVGLLLASLWLLAAETGIVVPHLAWGGLLFDVAFAEEQLGLEAQSGTPFAMLGVEDALLIVLCLTVGSAILPAHLVRVSAGGGPDEARTSLMRGLTIFLLVATALPALGVLAKASLLGFFVGGEGAFPFIAFAEDGEFVSGARICGVVAASAETVRAACETLGYAEGFPYEEITLEPQNVLFALPALTGAGGWILGLLAASAMAVVLVAGSGAAISFALAVTSRESPLDVERNGRIVLIVIVLLSALLALGTGLDVLTIGAWAFSLAGASLFAPVVFGLWWPRANRLGAIAGLCGGFAVTAVYIVGASWGIDLQAESGDEWVWLGVPPMAAGSFGILVSVFLTFWVSLATDAPGGQERARIENLFNRLPRLTVDPEPPKIKEDPVTQE